MSSVFLHNCETWTLTKTRSRVITRREPSWFGHLFYLSDDTLAKIALQYSLRQTKKPRRRQWTTWISMMKMKLLGMGLEWEAANRLAEDRLVWNNFIEWVSPMGFLHANEVRTITWLSEYPFMPMSNLLSYTMYNIIYIMYIIYISYIYMYIYIWNMFIIMMIMITGLSLLPK